MQPTTLEGTDATSPLPIVKPLARAIGGTTTHTTGGQGAKRTWWDVTGLLSPRKNKKGRLRADVAFRG